MSAQGSEKSLTAQATAEPLFPETPRCVFKHAPLAQVVCQLRFPPILAIEASVPAAFQDRIRGMLPLYERSTPSVLPQIPQIGQLPAEIIQMLGASAATQHLFKTEDRATTLNLTTDAISLTTTKYPRWPSFRQLLSEPLRALIDIYKPAFFTRIGLRYSNAITRQNIGLGEMPWSALFRHELLGELSIPQFEKSLDALATRALRLRLPNGEGAVLLRHGLGIVTGVPVPSQPSYVIDLDFFRDEKTELSRAEPILDRYHELAGHAFRWAISETLRVALGPSEPDDGE
jgi:uncharacterized protein (TIGR04255 family)